MVAGSSNKSESGRAKTAKVDSNGSCGEVTVGNRIIENLAEHCTEVFEGALRKAFELKRDVFVSALVEKVREVSNGGVEAPAENAPQTQGQWIKIESLSRLRNIVGGRFDN